MPVAAGERGRLEGRTVLVTGAAQGIGERVARTLRGEGARLVLADVQAAKVRAVAAELDAVGLTVDLAEEALVAAMAREAVAATGGIDALVNVAGIDAPFRAPSEVDAAHWDRLIDVNLTGTWRCIAALLPHLRERGGGRIVNIASICGLVPTPGVSVAYCASKAGVVGLTLALATELERDGILVNAIAPGSTGDTGEPIPARERAEYRARQPLGFGGAQPIADAVLHLLASSGDWLSGTVMNVSGGYWRGR
ncbi:SDR family NAD(P)-dependent oxidoreductase [Conexibacter arvalis]|uniref:NAD(P)-dependent dehydrogenase (Short-subunit alcohol dehydrogenase family) n=1 Tax=Conexibacter arvalis TaxID=912552 RepID=A0A840IAT6_9ACTN|nr:NAD(P)-dependent dehydrogenase (short-subunit alcohol dehydrogenase family) [Conexibacter arvalis]